MSKQGKPEGHSCGRQSKQWTTLYLSTRVYDGTLPDFMEGLQNTGVAGLEYLSWEGRSEGLFLNTNTK